jgi:hypothetical protein
MAEYKDREHYIPLRKADLVRLLVQDKQLPPAERDRFRQFARLVGAVFHFEYLQQLDELKDAYAPFDPDTETQSLKQETPEDRDKKLNLAFDDFVRLMERANFKRLTWADVEAAMAGGASDWGVNMYVDRSLYERIEIFIRGDTIGKRTRRRWNRLFRLEEVKLPIYRRLVFMVKIRPHRVFGRAADTRSIYLKAFKDVPKLDLEMLLPGAQLEMPRLQRWKIGGSLLSGLAFLLWKIWAELLELFDRFAIGQGGLIWGPIAALFGYGYKQYYGYSTMRQSYHLMLKESLYFQNLDNNAGVLTRLLDEAEEQECREVLLAYYFLWRYAPPQGWTSGQLDDYVELYLEGAAKLKIDFEIGAALAKLVRLNLVRKTGEMYHAVAIEAAIAALERAWSGHIRDAVNPSSSPLPSGERGRG